VKEDSQPGLYIRVYSVDPNTGKHTDVLPVTLAAPTTDPTGLMSSAWPPCGCPRHCPQTGGSTPPAP
jgi:hypothetical protein